MFYDFAILVPAGRLESSPVTQELKLTAGVVQKVHILFPPGCWGEVRVRIKEGGHQYLPTNPDGYFWSDDEVVKADDEYYTLEAPYLLTVIAYSPTATYNHTIGVRVSILRPEEVEKTSGWIASLKKFLKLVGIG